MTNDKHDRDVIVDRLLAAGMAPGLRSSSTACLDDDTLAAWADDALDAAGRAAVEAHAADCGQCQALLAAMVKSTPAPVVSNPWWTPSLRWLVPLSAAATAALLWVVVAPRQSPVTVHEISQNAETAAASPTTATSDAPLLPAETAAPGGARREQPAPAPDSQDNAIAADKRVAAPSPDANPLLDTSDRRAEPAAEKSQAAQAAASAPAASAPPAPAARVFSFAAAETVIVSSNPGSRWRIVPGGAVQRSADGGATWQLQNTGATETLTAGSSPSPSVCWLVGPGGIVLLSTDDRSWHRVAFPEPVQLVAIRATDDQVATVTTADGREFVTENGGRTWARAPAR